MRGFAFNKGLIVLGVALLFFSVYFFKPSLVGYDSYFFYNMVCGVEPLHEAPQGALFVFEWLPCSLNSAKILLLGIALACLFLLKGAGELVSAKWGFLAPLFFLASPAFSELLKFEDDQLGYPFIFLGVYFLFKHGSSKSVFDILKAIGAFLVAGLFWKGAFLFVMVALFSGIFWPIAIELSIIFFNKLRAVIDFNFVVWENFPIIGILSQHIFLIGFYSLSVLPVPTLLFAFLALMKAKYFPFLTIFLCVLSVRTFERFTKIQRVGLLLLVSLMLLANLASIPTHPFNQSQIDGVDRLLEYANEHDLNYRNNLIYGYYIQSVGGETWIDGGDYTTEPFSGFNGVVLESWDVRTETDNCELVETIEENYLFVCEI